MVLRRLFRTMSQAISGNTPICCGSTMRLNAHLRPSKPPKPEELRKAKWGIGGQGVGLRDGKVWSGSDRKPDKRTAVGIDAERKLLFLTVAEWASPRLLLEQLSKLGARDAMLLDGGGSSAMAIGEGGQNLTRRSVAWGLASGCDIFRS